MGGSSTHITSQKYDGVIVQSSLKGVAVPKGWGTFKTGCNLIDYLDFTSKKVKTAGKGGGAQSSYDYYATLMMAICLGPIFGVRTIYQDSAYYIAQGSGSKEVNGTAITISSKTPVQAAGLTQLFLGSASQAPWTYLQSAHPGDALGYSGLAYVAAENFSLNTSATSPNFNFEVQSLIRGTVSGVTVDDANPADIVNDLLPDVPRWPAGAVGDLSAHETYCYAQGLLLSPVVSGGRQASDLLTEIMTCSNSDCFMSEGLFQVVPLGDIEIAANGVTYTPDMTPIYSLTWDDIIPNSDGEDPFQWDIKPADECYNYVVVGFLDRSQQYASDSVPAIDQAAYNTFGPVRADAVSYDSICDAGVAATVAQLGVQRSANVRRTAKVVVSELFGLLDPLDLIEIPDMTGAPVLVRINATNEQEDGSIELDVEEMLVGTSHAPLYTRQEALGIASNFAVDPGDSVAPTIINPPASLTSGQYEVWIASAGGPQWGGCVVWVSLDGDEFYNQGRITQAGRFGVTTSDLPATADPDTTDTFGVNLTASSGELTTATQADADAQTTLCAVGTEIIAYSAATLTGASTYSLGAYIRRGLEGTAVADQPSGSLFLRLDDAIAPITYNAGQIGKPLYIKLQSFNLFGNGYQDLDLCETYEFTAELNGTSVGDVAWTAITGVPQLVLDYVDSGGIANSTAHVQPTAEIGDSGLTADQVASAAVAGAAAVTAAGQAVAATTTLQTSLEEQSDALVAQALQSASALLAQHASTFTASGLPLGPFTEFVAQQSATSTQTLSVMGEVTPSGDGFVLSQTGVYVVNADGTTSTLSLALTELSSATGALSATLTESYLTATQVTGQISTAISAAETSLNTSIPAYTLGQVNATLSADYYTGSTVDGKILTAVSAAETSLSASIPAYTLGQVNATLTSDYSTTATTNGLITTAVSAAETSLSSSIPAYTLGQVNATLTTNYSTTTTTNGLIATAISAAETSLTSTIEGNINATLTSDYLTSASTTAAISSATTSLTAANSGSLGASVTTTAAALSSVQGALSGTLAMSVGAGGTVTSVDLIATSSGTTAATSLSEVLISCGILVITDQEGHPLFGISDTGAYISTNLNVAGNLNLAGALVTSSLAGGAVTNIYYIVNNSPGTLPVLATSGAPGGGSSGPGGSGSGGGRLSVSE